MINSINIKNFILFDELELFFSEGLNVFTGETGAGKSIIISAINAAFGGRVSKDMIRTGKDKAFIEVMITLRDGFDAAVFEENGIDLVGNEIIISREILPSASRMRINGSIVTLEFMKTIRESLLDVHSQHQTYAFLQSANHIKLLDEFGDKFHFNLLNEHKKLYCRFKELEKSLEEAEKLNESSAVKIDFLRFQINEIESASIESEDEDSVLKNELNLLLNAEKLREYSAFAYKNLSAEEGALNFLTLAGKEVSKASLIDPVLSEFENELLSASDVIKEISFSMKRYCENISSDIERLSFVEARVDLLDTLKHKYGKTLSEVKVSLENFKKELSDIDFSCEKIDGLKKDIAEVNSALTKSSGKITGSRKKLAEKLSTLVTAELFKLELPNANFYVDITQADLGASGNDKVEFLISTNVSEAPKNLSKIASGGEMSRIMLAMKIIFANADQIDTVVFDEIDSGISGKASQAVAAALSELSKSHQILSVTHQPIIASRADKYFYVLKENTDQTVISVKELEGENKTEALALMARGAVTEDSVNFARDLLNSI